MKKIHLRRLCALALALLLALSTGAVAELSTPLLDGLEIKSLDGTPVANSTTLEDGDEILLSSSSKSAKATVGDSFTVDLKDGYGTSWSSSNKKVAKVDNGFVECLKAGSATITVKGITDDDKNVSRKLKLTVKAGSSDSAKGVKIFFDDEDAGDTYTFKSGETWNTFPGWNVTLQAEVTPEGADQDVTWSSSKSSVVSIDKESGELLAKKTGKAKITAKAPNGKKQTVVISVKKYSYSAKLSKSSLQRDANDSEEAIVAVKSMTVENYEKAVVTFVLFNGTDEKISKLSDIDVTLTGEGDFSLSGTFSSVKVNCKKHSNKEFKLTFKKDKVESSWPGPDRFEPDLSFSFT